MTETTTMTSATPKTTPMPRNGVDTPKLFATIDVVAGQPELAKFQFRAQCRWVKGTHSRTTMSGFSGAGGEHSHVAAFKADSDHPAVLCGEDNGPTPVEYLLHALAGCLTAGIANIAAARGVTLDEVESTVEGDADLRGILGLSKEVRNGFQAIRVSFRVKGDAPEAKLREIVEQSRARSAVYDMLTNGAPVTIAVNV
ncbi:MAG TPA: OsmC family protein [Azospirillum sp.]|nr:OsmC family protein [Azospirillum sp.]